MLRDGILAHLHEGDVLVVGRLHEARHHESDCILTHLHRDTVNIIFKKLLPEVASVISPPLVEEVTPGSTRELRDAQFSLFSSLLNKLVEFCGRWPNGLKA